MPFVLPEGSMSHVEGPGSDPYYVNDANYAAALAKQQADRESQELSTAEWQKSAGNYPLDYPGIPGTSAPPTVTGSVPADGATAVAVTVAPTVTFNEEMAAGTINATNIRLLVTATSVAVAATVAYDPATRTATITPDVALTALTQYTIEVGVGVTDADGIPLASVFTANFTTA